MPAFRSDFHLPANDSSRGDAEGAEKLKQQIFSAVSASPREISVEFSTELRLLPHLISPIVLFHRMTPRILHGKASQQIKAKVMQTNEFITFLSGPHYGFCIGSEEEFGLER